MSDARRPPGRHWSGDVYYYVAALIGLSLVIFGTVGAMRGLIQAALPTATPDYRYRVPEIAKPVDGAPATLAPAQPAADRSTLEREAARAVRREGLYGALQGLSLVAVGAPVFLWHIRRARRREGDRDTAEADPG